MHNTIQFREKQNFSHNSNHLNGLSGDQASLSSYATKALHGMRTSKNADNYML